MQSTRRGVLATLGVSLVSAGCLSSPPADQSNTTGGTSPTPTPASDDGRRVSMGTTVTVGGTSITVENPRVRKAVVTPGMAHTRVVANAGQFVVVDITVNGTSPDQYFDRDFWSVVDGKTLQGSDPLPTTDERGYAFTFPAARHDKAAIQWETDKSDVYWSLPQSVLETLAVEPKFVVTDFQVPRRSGELVLELTVANEGNRDGHFAARVSFEAYSGGSIIEFPIPSGESKSYIGRPGKILLYFENHGGETLTVEYPADDGLTTIERTVNTSKTTTN